MTPEDLELGLDAIKERVAKLEENSVLEEAQYILDMCKKLHSEICTLFSSAYSRLSSAEAIEFRIKEHLDEAISANINTQETLKRWANYCEINIGPNLRTDRSDKFGSYLHEAFNKIADLY